MRRARRTSLPMTLALILGASFATAAGPVVVTVGDLKLDADDVSRRLSKEASFKLEAMGKDEQAIKKAFVEKELVPELLWAKGAEDRHLEKDIEVRRQIDRLYLEALRADLEREINEKNPITPEDVATYYQKNLSRFHSPERIKIWRILVGSEAEAKKLLADLSRKPTKERWSKTTREKSLDKATHLREGDLGFVLPDGRTHVPRVKVDNALYEAALKVKNGELVPDPVKEGERYAVIWRRGSLPATERSMESEAGNIARQLLRERQENSRKALLDSLQKKANVTKQEALLAKIDMKSFGDLGDPPPKARAPRVRRRPPAAASGSSSASPAPSTTDLGER